MPRGDIYFYFNPLHIRLDGYGLGNLGIGFWCARHAFWSARMQTKDKRGDFSLNLGTLLSHILSNPIVPASFTYPTVGYDSWEDANIYKSPFSLTVTGKLSSPCTTLMPNQVYDQGSFSAFSQFSMYFLWRTACKDTEEVANMSGCLMPRCITTVMWRWPSFQISGPVTTDLQ